MCVCVCVRVEHKNFITQTCLFTSPDAHSAYMHKSLNYTCISTPPADKAGEHRISSYKLLLLIMEKKTCVCVRARARVCVCVCVCVREKSNQ